MECKICGAQLAEGAKFCPNCGAAVSEVQPEVVVNEPVVAAAPVIEPVAAPAAPVPGNSTPVLVWGILGLAFACSFYLSILGIIFSAIAKGKASKYLAEYGMLTGKARTGRGLAIAGLIVGIILTVIFVIVVVILGALGSSGGYYY